MIVRYVKKNKIIRKYKLDVQLTQKKLKLLSFNYNILFISQYFFNIFFMPSFYSFFNFSLFLSFYLSSLSLTTFYLTLCTITKLYKGLYEKYYYQLKYEVDINVRILFGLMH